MRTPQPEPPDFDPIARAYRWLEYLTFGPMLERCRFHQIARLGKSKHALILGDGDGRFVARLLHANQDLHADVVDSSTVMLRLLRSRCEKQVPDAHQRLRCHKTDALAFAGEVARDRGAYDLVATHFFFDCLDQERADLLAIETAKVAKAGAVWIVSDFRIPPGAMKIPAQIIVRVLYIAFGALTGLRTGSLPDHAGALRRAGFACESVDFFTGGMLFSESWRLAPR